MPDGKKNSKISLFVLTFDTTYERDRHTDTAWRHRPRLCIASRGKNGKFDPPVNTKWLFKRRPEYMITSRSWVVVQNPSKIGPPNFDEGIGKVWVFYSHTQTTSQSNSFFHLAYRSQIWKDLKHLWLKTCGLRTDVPFGGIIDDKSCLGVQIPPKNPYLRTI